MAVSVSPASTQSKYLCRYRHLTSRPIRPTLRIMISLLVRLIASGEEAALAAGHGAVVEAPTRLLFEREY